MYTRDFFKWWRGIWTIWRGGVLFGIKNTTWCPDQFFHLIEEKPGRNFPASYQRFLWLEFSLGNFQQKTDGEDRGQSGELLSGNRLSCYAGRDIWYRILYLGSKDFHWLQDPKVVVYETQLLVRRPRFVVGRLRRPGQKKAGNYFYSRSDLLK